MATQKKTWVRWSDEEGWQYTPWSCLRPASEPKAEEEEVMSAAHLRNLQGTYSGVNAICTKCPGVISAGTKYGTVLGVNAANAHASANGDPNKEQISNPLSRAGKTCWVFLKRCKSVVLWFKSELSSRAVWEEEESDGHSGGATCRHGWHGRHLHLTSVAQLLPHPPLSVTAAERTLRLENNWPDIWAGVCQQAGGSHWDKVELWWSDDTRAELF